MAADKLHLGIDDSLALISVAPPQIIPKVVKIDTCDTTHVESHMPGYVALSYDHSLSKKR
jgi:hypothetical protein